VDAARIEAVSAAVGEQRLQELISILGGRVRKLAAAAEAFPEGAEDWLAALHQSRGSAASLGFLALAEALARMEELGREAVLRAEEVRLAGRALPGLWEEVLQAQTALFRKELTAPVRCKPT